MLPHAHTEIAADARARREREREGRISEMRAERKRRHLRVPVMLSHKMRDVMMRPNGANSASSSLWHIVFGMPLTYKLAPLMFSLLGRANETCVESNVQSQSGYAAAGEAARELDYDELLLSMYYLFYPPRTVVSTTGQSSRCVCFRAKLARPASRPPRPAARPALFREIKTRRRARGETERRRLPRRFRSI